MIANNVRRGLKLGAILLCLAPSAQGTPDASRWISETLLGVDKLSYWLLERQIDNPGSHYNYYETFALVRRSNRTAQEEERIGLASFSYLDATATGEWQRSRTEASDLTLADFLLRAHLEPVLPGAPMSGEPTLVLTSAGLFFERSGVRTLVTPDLLGLAPPKGASPQEIVITNTYYARDYDMRYIVVGEVADECWFLHTTRILPLPQQVLYEARRKAEHPSPSTGKP